RVGEQQRRGPRGRGRLVEERREDLPLRRAGHEQDDPPRGVDLAQPERDAARRGAAGSELPLGDLARLRGELDHLRVLRQGAARLVEGDVAVRAESEEAERRAAVARELLRVAPDLGGGIARGAVDQGVALRRSLERIEQLAPQETVEAARVAGTAADV